MSKLDHARVKKGSSGLSSLRRTALIVIYSIVLVTVIVGEPLIKTLTDPSNKQHHQQQVPIVVVKEDFFSNKTQYAHVHIPKAGGDSWCREFVVRNTQGCYDDLLHRQDVKFGSVLIRSPQTHIRSQFGECTFDKWGLRITKDTGFPRTDNIEKDFEDWIQHFTDLKREDIGKDVDYGCYDPRDIQTRFMSCNNAHNPKSNHALAQLPRLDRALVNMMDADFVGITDFYSESACIYSFRRKHVMPPGCFCDERETSNHTHVTHNVPSGFSAKTQLQPAEVQRQMREMTRLDTILFVASLQRFLYDVKVAETVANNRQILCDDKIQKAQDLLNEYSKSEACLEFEDCMNLFENLHNHLRAKVKSFRHIRSP